MATEVNSINAYDVTYNNGECVVRVIAESEEDAREYAAYIGIVIYRDHEAKESEASDVVTDVKIAENLDDKLQADLVYIRKIWSDAKSRLAEYEARLREFCDAEPRDYNAIIWASVELDMARAIFNEKIVRGFGCFRYFKEYLPTIADHKNFLNDVVDRALSNQDSETTLIDGSWGFLIGTMIDIGSMKGRVEP